MTKSPPHPSTEPPHGASPSSRARYLAGRILEEGPAEPFRRFLYRHGHYRRLALVVAPRLRPRKRPRPTPEDMTPSWFGPSDLDDYLALRPDQSAEEIEARLRAGHVCMVVRHERRLIAHSWLGSGRMDLDYLDCVMVLAPGVCQYYDEFVAPEHRRVGALRTVSRMRRRYQEDHELRWRVMTFLPENLQAFRRIGRFRPVFVGEVGRVSLGPWTRLFLRLDRELTSSDDVPLALFERDGRPARMRRVEGPLGLERAFWARREAPKAPPMIGALDRSGLHRRRLLTVFPSDAPPQGGFRADVEAGRLEREDLEAYLDLRPDQDRAEIERRWRAGHVCFVCRGYGRLAGASWLAPAGGSFSDLGCEVRLGPETAGVYDEFVRPSLRRMHVLNPVDELRGQHALGSGWKQCVSLVPPEVRGAWLRMRRNERPVLGELSSWQVGPIRRLGLHLAPGATAAELHCTLSDGSRPIPIR